MQEVWTTTLEGHRGVTMSADGTTLLWEEGAPTGGEVVARDLGAGSQQRVMLPISSDAGGSLAVTDDGATAFFAVDRQIHRVDLAAGTTDLVADASRALSEGEHACPEECEPLITELAVSADGSTVAFLLTDAMTFRQDANPSWPSQFVVGHAEQASNAPPTWPTDAGVRVAEVGATFATLEWDAAADDRAVTGYEVLLNGESASAVGARDRRATLDGLSPDTEYRIAVVPLDADAARGPELAMTVRTAPAVAQAALSAEARADGTVRLRWDPATGETVVYRVMRAIGDAAEEQVAETDSLTWQDTNAPAESALTYRVDVVRDEVTQTHSVETQVVTPEISSPDVTWASARLPGGSVALTEQVSVSVVGQPHRDVRAVLEGEDAVGETNSIDFSLTEEAPGRYVGTIDAPTGLAVISSVYAVMSDGHGHEVTGDAPWTTLPATVSGAVEVTVDAAASIADAVLDVADPDTRWSRQHAFGEEHRVLLPVPPSSDLELALWRPDGAKTASADGIVAPPGEIASQTLVYRHPANVIVTVQGPAGEPMSGIAVDVNVPGSSNATTGTTGEEGTVNSSGWLNGMRAEITLSSKLIPLREQQPVTVDLVPGENAVTVEALPVAEGSVRGTVTINGVPHPNNMRGSVRLTQIVDGIAVARETKVAEDGSYEVTGFHGPAKLTMQFPSSRNVYRDVVIGDAPVIEDYGIVRGGYDVLRLNLRAQDFGAPEPGPAIEIDGATRSHMRIKVEREREDGSWGMSSGTWDGSDVRVFGHPGDRYRLCADGWEMGAPQACSDPVALTATESILPVELVMQSTARATIDLAEVSGAPVSGMWKATLTSGTRTFLYRGEGARIDADLPEGGTYQLWVQTGSHTYGTATVTVTDGTHHRHPEVVVVGRDFGAFRGDGNALASTQSVVQPGATVDLRATYRAASSVRGADLHLALPPGWQSIPEGATVNGEPVSVRTEGDAAVIALGDIDAGTEGVVRITVRASDGTGPQHLIASIIDSRGNSNPLGAVVLELAGITMDAPDIVRERSATLSGRAPAGSVVTLFEGDAVVGIALAGPSGRWDARVSDLRQLPVGYSYVFRAEVEDSGLSTDQVRSVYDPFRTRITEIEMLQDERSVRFDPADGVARFPFVYSQRPVQFLITFDDPASVTSATIWFGDRQAQAVQQDDGRFVASFPLRFGQEGDISVTFEADRAPVDLGSAALGLPESIEVARDLLPATWQDFEADDVEVQPIEDGERVVVTGSLPARAGQSDATAISLSVETAAADDFVPSLPSTAMANSAGVPIYDVTLDVVGDGESGTVTAFYIAEETAAQRGAISAFASPAGVRRSIKLTWDIVGGVDGINGLFQQGERTEKIRRTMKELDDLVACTAEGFAKVTELRKQAQLLLSRAIDLDIFGVVSLVGGTSAGLMLSFLGGATVSEALWGAGQWLGKDWDNAYAALRAGMNIDDCDDKPTPPPGPDGIPTPIYDPSGYVYEAVPENRLEGVTATVLYAPAPEGPWEVWDAEWYAQENPHQTSAEGRYGWDVPIGFWQVRYEHDRYVTAYSDVLEVLPPHFDVNVGLVSRDAPQMDRVTATPDGILIEFSQYMRADWFTEDHLSVMRTESGIVLAGPEESDPVDLTIPGTLAAVDPAQDAAGNDLATSFRFTPDVALAIDSEIDVLVRAGVRNYAERPMLADSTNRVPVTAVPVPDPEEPGDPDDSGSSADAGGSNDAGGSSNAGGSNDAGGSGDANGVGDADGTGGSEIASDAGGSGDSEGSADATGGAGDADASRAESDDLAVTGADASTSVLLALLLLASGALVISRTRRSEALGLNARR